MAVLFLGAESQGQNPAASAPATASAPGAPAATTPVNPAPTNPPAPTSKTPTANPYPPGTELTREKMKELLLKKNIFNPAKTVPQILFNPVVTVSPNFLPAPLNRPFKFLAFDQNDAGPRAYLEFDNVCRPVNPGEIIETIRILAIHSTYMRCKYGDYDVRIDIGETSNDALLHLEGFERGYEFIGTEVYPDSREAFAHIMVGGRHFRVETGEKIGDAVIVKIESGKVWLLYEDGTKTYIEPAARTN